MLDSRSSCTGREVGDLVGRTIHAELTEESMASTDKEAILLMLEDSDTLILGVRRVLFVSRTNRSNRPNRFNGQRRFSVHNRVQETDAQLVPPNSPHLNLPVIL